MFALQRNRFYIDTIWVQKNRSKKKRPLLGILETSLRGRSTRNDLNIRRSTSTFASAKIVIDLIRKLGSFRLDSTSRTNVPNRQVSFGMKSRRKNERLERFETFDVKKKCNNNSNGKEKWRR